MRKRDCVAMRVRRAPAVAAGSALLAIGLAACSGRPGPTATDGPAPLSVPSVTSISASDGSWVVLPMGHLDQPLNTFWQLFFRPATSQSWSNHVEATGAASNGGLALATEGDSVLVGVRPSNHLTYSPLIVTTDSGASWSNGLLTSGLAPFPDTLALGPAGQALALVESRSGEELLSTDGSLSDWTTVATTSSLESASRRTCDPSSMTAVAYLGASPVIGANCTRHGEAGIFAGEAAGYELSGPPMPAEVANASVQVLGIWPSSSGLVALLGAATSSRTELFACWEGAAGSWTVSGPLALEMSDQIESFGHAEPGGIFVLMKGSSGPQRAMLVDGPGSAWDELPAPPAKTATLAFGGGGIAQALVVTDTLLRVWTLGSGSSSWQQTQMINVPIQFGTSG